MKNPLHTYALLTAGCLTIFLTALLLQRFTEKGILWLVLYLLILLAGSVVALIRLNRKPVNSVKDPLLIRLEEKLDRIAPALENARKKLRYLNTQTLRLQKNLPLYRYRNSSGLTLARRNLSTIYTQRESAAQLVYHLERAQQNVQDLHTEYDRKLQLQSNEQEIRSLRRRAEQLDREVEQLLETVTYDLPTSWMEEVKTLEKRTLSR